MPEQLFKPVPSSIPRWLDCYTTHDIKFLQGPFCLKNFHRFKFLIKLDHNQRFDLNHLSTFIDVIIVVIAGSCTHLPLCRFYSMGKLLRCSWKLTLIFRGAHARACWGSPSFLRFRSYGYVAYQRLQGCWHIIHWEPHSLTVVHTLKLHCLLGITCTHLVCSVAGNNFMPVFITAELSEFGNKGCLWFKLVTLCWQNRSPSPALALWAFGNGFFVNLDYFHLHNSFWDNMHT